MSTGNSTVIGTTAISSESLTRPPEPTKGTSFIETTTSSPSLTTESIPTSTAATSPPPPPPPPPTSTPKSTPTSTPTSTPISTPTASATTTTVGVIESTTINGTPTTVTVTVTSTNLSAPSNPTSDTYSATTSTGTVQTGGANTSHSVGGGLSGGALIAIAVIVPVVILAVLAVGLVLYFKRRKTNRNVPPKGPVASGIIGGGGPPLDSDRGGVYEMNETDSAGYRGWGSTVRNPKSTVAGSSGYPISSVGKTVSDGGYSNPASASPPGYTGNMSELYGGVNAPASPVFPDSAGLLAVDRAAPSPVFTESSTIGAIPTFDSHNSGGLNRGISNASSNYSAMTHSDQSDLDQRQSQQYYGPDAQDYDAAYFSSGPNMYYDDTSNPPPVIRDVQARRNTRIETPTSAHLPQHGSSGIARNF
ncbi:hypothetical protein EV426DRAFT_313669 [Tirmania nivea]|nr:hypothetical protein EV426DRAFT_313669 [Tirmania nivea]